MSSDLVTLVQEGIRGADSNSLLRLYDSGTRSSRSRSQQERMRADKAVQRITHELRKRNVWL
jgi:hypothetical protein